MKSCRLLVAICVACLLTAAASAQEWPRFRGPNGAGQSEATTIPTAWTAEEVLWKVELPGKGNASPVLWGDRIFLTSANPADGTRHVTCHSARDGRLLWQRDYPSTTHPLHQQNTFASSTPAADAKRVYCAWATPQAVTLVALDHEGTEAWRIDLGPFVSQHGFGASPIVYRDLVILPNDQDGESFLVAVDAASGAIRWKVPRKVLNEQNASYAAPCVFERPGRTDELIVSGRSHGVTALNPLDGTTLWEAGVLERRPVGSPIIVAGMVLAACGEGSGNNNLIALRPPATAGAEPTVAYRIDRTSAPYVPTMVAFGELVFLWSDKGIVTCIDAQSGSVHWRERVGGNYYSSPLRVANCVYCVSLEGDVVALAASDKFELLGRSSLGETTRATPAVALGRMFLRTESHLVAVGQR
ncbi:MAG: PQQ-binding-like beta-propeller repeat protein [Pirellulales bacterium]